MQEPTRIRREGPRIGGREDDPTPSAACDPLLALRAGDAAPFEAFVRAHVRTFVAYFLQRGASREGAEDLTQELFLRLFQGAPRYRPRGRFVAYAFRAARNLLVDDRRRTAAGPAVRPLEVPPGGLAPSSDALDPPADLVLLEERERLERLLAALPAGQRGVFELAVLGELSYEEIGNVLEVPVGTVKSRMFHAVRRLRFLWGDRQLVLQAQGRP